MRLDGKVAAITGAAGGQGRAAAHLFAEEGARLVVTGIDEEGAEKTAEEIRDAGGEAISLSTGVSREKIDLSEEELDRLADVCRIEVRQVILVLVTSLLLGALLRQPFREVMLA